MDAFTLMVIFGCVSLVGTKDKKWGVPKSVEPYGLDGVAIHCYVDSAKKDKDTDRYILSHWGRVTHICVGNLTIIGLDKGLSPGRRQAITWTNTGILFIGPLGTNFSEISIGIPTFSF